MASPDCIMESIPRSHQVLNANATIVAVGVVRETTQTLISTDATQRTFSIRVGDQTVTSLKSNVRLEGVSSHAADHL